MTNLTPWRKIAEPHRDIREERFDPSVFAANLGMVLRNEGPVDYRDPVTFFKKTYLTQGLSSLMQDALNRLSGGPRGEAVIQIQIPFGGGKTHVLIALYHLFAQSQEIEHLESIQSLLEEAELRNIPDCRIAAMVGTALDPEGRETEEGIQIRTLWGEMAYQFGGADLYQLIEANDRNRSAPGTDKLMDLLEGLGPVLILVDEALQYATKAGSVEVGEGTLLGQTLAFLQELSSVAANRPKTMLVGAIPSSYLERYDQSAEKAFQQLNKIFGRMEQIRSPVQGDEIYEILRRRLFEDVGTDAQKRDVVEAYWDFYQAHSDDLPRKATEVSYRERMLRSYPFHPELVDILYERWGSLPNFQRTRGVLRLLAMVVGNLYKRSSGSALIQPAHVVFSDTRVRREFVKLVGDPYETVIGSDISNHAKAPQIDQELGGQYAQEHIAEGLATSIFLYSHTGGKDSGCTFPQLRLSLLHPDMTPALVADALDRLSDKLWYLYEEPKWHFETVAGLNKIRVEREDAVEEEDIWSRVRSTLSDLVGPRVFKRKRTYLWPQENSDVDDNRDLRLVILDPDHTASSEETEEFIRALLKRKAKTFRTYRNTLILLAPNDSDVEKMRQAGRTLIALEVIAVDYGGGDRLTEQQQEELKEDLDNARSALPQMIYQAYRHIIIPGEEDRLHHLDMGLQLFKKDRELCQQVWNHLVDRDIILERLDPHLIRGERWNLWTEKDQPLRVSQLRDYFARYTQLPMLAPELLVETIARGIELKLFGYGHREGKEGDFAPLYFGQTVPSNQLEIADTAWLIPPDMAKKLSLSSISGRILDEDGEPITGVTVRLSPSGQTVVTGSDGTYEFTELSPGDYTIAPSKSGFDFSPASHKISLSGEEMTGLDFAGREVIGPPSTYKLSGQIQTEAGKALEDVRLLIDPPVVEEVISETKGKYAFGELQEGNYTIKPKKTGFTFEPTEITVTANRDVSGQNFVASKEKEGVRGVEVHTKVPWENWYEFYSDVLDPLMSRGAEIDIRLKLKASLEEEFESDLIERLQDSLRKYDEDAEIEDKR